MRAHSWSRLALVGLLSIFGTTACGPATVSSTSGQKKDSSAATSGTGAVINAKADFSLAARAFYEEVKKDNEAATAKYKDRSVEVEGTIRLLGQAPAGGQVMLVAGEGPADMVACFTNDKEPWKKMTPGQKVKIRGKWPQFALGPTLTECTVVEIGPQEAIPIKAADLAKEFASAPEETKTKYEDKHLIITGEIAKRDKNYLYLKPDDKLKLECVFDPALVPSDAQAGQTITIYGRVALLLIRSSQIQLMNCQPAP